jgi:hypothetical protein
MAQIRRGGLSFNAASQLYQSLQQVITNDGEPAFPPQLTARTPAQIQTDIIHRAIKTLPQHELLRTVAVMREVWEASDDAIGLVRLLISRFDALPNILQDGLLLSLFRYGLEQSLVQDGDCTRTQVHHFVQILAVKLDSGLEKFDS